MTPSEVDLTALQGRWLQVAWEADGAVAPPDEYAGTITSFVDQRFEVRTPDGTLVLAGTFTLDASTSPKAITWTDSMGPDAGKQLPASYVLDGDHFVFIAGDEGAPRPTVFSTTPGQTMRTFVRVSIGG